MVKGEAFSVLPPKKKPRKNSEKKVTFVEIKERVPKPRQPRTTGHPSQPRTASSAAAGHLEHSPEQDNDFEQPSVNSYGSWDCAAVDLEKAAGVKPQSSNQQQKRSANRNARTESNWQQHREQQVSMYLQTHSSRLQLQRGIIISISAAYVKSLWTGHCPRCGLDAADCDFRDIRTVLIGDHFTVHRVEAPIFGCSRCGCKLAGCSCGCRLVGESCVHQIRYSSKANEACCGSAFYYLHIWLVLSGCSWDSLAL